jgi:hypothetical protein
VPVGAVLLAALFVDPIVRFSFLVFGGLFTLQTSQQLTDPKLFYLLGTALALGLALAAIGRSASTPAYVMLRPLLWLSAVLGAVLVVSLPVALAHQTPVSTWVRDAAPYVLFASVPVFALDVSTSRFRHWLPALFLIAGLLTAASLSVGELNRRRLVESSLVPLLVLPSFFLPAALFSYGMGRLMTRGTNRTWWVVTMTLIAALLLLTGSRSTLLLVLPAVAVLVLYRPTIRLNRRSAVVAARSIALVLLFLAIIAFFTRTSPSGLIGRFGSIETLVTRPQSDKSLDVRLFESNQAWQVFLKNPLLGAGPGHIFTWTDWLGKAQASFNIDSGLAVPAKFGIVGTAAFGFALLYLVWFGVRFRLRGPPVMTAAMTAVAGIALLSLAWFFLGSPFEEKGLGFGLLFLLAIASASISEAPSRGLS